MIKECISKTGIEFDMEYLMNDLDFDIEELLKEMFEKGDYDRCYEMIEKCGWDKHKQKKPRLNAERDSDDPISDDLAGRLWYCWRISNRHVVGPLGEGLKRRSYIEPVSKRDET